MGQAKSKDNPHVISQVDLKAKTHLNIEELGMYRDIDIDLIRFLFTFNTN